MVVSAVLQCKQVPNSTIIIRAQIIQKSPIASNEWPYPIMRLVRLILQEKCIPKPKAAPAATPMYMARMLNEIRPSAADQRELQSQWDVK